MRRKGERVGVSIILQGGREINEFNQFIDDMELIDIPLVGRNFTQYHQNGKAKSRIDRVMKSREWLEAWQGCSQYVLDRDISDHFSLLVTNNTFDWGLKPFAVSQLLVSRQKIQRGGKGSLNWNKFGSESRNLGDLLYRMNG